MLTSENVAIKDDFLLLPTIRRYTDTVRAKSFLQWESWPSGILAWFGPTFAQQNLHFEGVNESSKHRSSFGGGFQIRLRKPFGKRWCAVNFSLLAYTAQPRGFSLQWNIHLPCVVAEDADIFYYVKTGNIEAVKLMFASREGSPSDTMANGTTLLHVSIMRGISDMCTPVSNDINNR
jgi:hypothetical protein